MVRKTLERIIGIGFPIAAVTSRIYYPDEVADIVGSHQARAAIEHFLEGASVLYWWPLIGKTFYNVINTLLRQPKKVRKKWTKVYNDTEFIAKLFIGNVALWESVQVFTRYRESGQIILQPEQYIASILGIGLGYIVYRRRNSKSKTDNY